MATIYIARKDVFGVGEHSYWVFDPDGNPYSGDERVIRGGVPADVEHGGDNSDYVLEADRPIEDSRDRLNGDDPFGDRWYTTAWTGTLEDGNAKWDEMVDTAKALGEPKADPTVDENGNPAFTDESGNPHLVWEPPLNDYFIFAPNCNCLTNTVGREAGFDVDAVLPRQGGDLNPNGQPLPEFQYEGIDTIFTTTGDDEVTIGDDTEAIFDQGGNDTYVVDATSSLGNREIDIFEDSDTGTIDKIVIQNALPADIRFQVAPNGDLEIYLPSDGDILPSIRIQDQFSEDGAPKMNTLWVEPPGGGTPFVIPLNNPDDFPRYTPQPVAGWVPQSIIPFETAPQQNSPLVLDLDGDGVELLALDTANPSTFFDLDNDGFAEATGWVAPDDGLLARDINGNGKIDNASELFGSTTVDGFAILSEMDTNGDLMANAFDTDFDDLLIWQDVNGDGVSQAGELQSLSDYNIASIDLAGVAPSTDVIAGNEISHVSSFAYTNGSTGAVVDAWFAVDNTLSTYMQDYTLDVRTLFLPTLRGYGELADLHVAMSLDNGTGGLLEQVTDFATSFSFADFADDAALRSEIESILFTWAGTTPEGQQFPDGPYVGAAAYAEEFQFLEKQFGVLSESSIDGNTGGRVAGGSARALMESFEISYQNVKAHLLVQVGAAELFENPVTYSVVSGEINGDLSLSQTAIADLETYASAPGVDAQDFWVSVAQFLDTVKGYANFTATEDGWFNAAIANTDPALDWRSIKDLTAFDYQPSTIFGTNDADVIDGTAGDNIIAGYQGADTIDGKAGNDTITSNTSGPTTPDDDDILIGGEGDDFVNGGQGHDTYIYTSGDDYYEDKSGNDVIRLPEKIAAQDLSYRIQDNYNLIVDIAELGSIEIKDQF